MLKREELLEDCDIEAVIDALGIPVRRQGRYIDILCPKHIGTFGSCKVDINKKLCRCFRCNETMTPFDLVMNANSCSYFEAFKFVAETTGRADDYIISDKKNTVKTDDFPLSKDEMEMLNLHALSLNDLDSISLERLERGFSYSDGDLYINEVRKRISLQDLRKKDVFLFYMVVAHRIYSFINEKREIYDWIKPEKDFNDWECIKTVKKIIKKLKLERFMELIRKENAPKKQIRIVQTSDPSLPF